MSTTTDTPNDIVLIQKALQKRGWTVTNAWSPVTNKTFPRHEISLGVAMHEAGRPPVSITLAGAGANRKDAVKNLREQAQEWGEATDKGRDIILRQREKRRLEDQAAEIYQAVRTIDEQLVKLRIEDFVENIHEYIGHIKWTISSVSDIHVRLEALKISDASEIRIASRLGFGHHGGAEISPGIRLRSDDGDVSLTADGFEVLLTFFYENDLLSTLDLGRFDTMILEAHGRMEVAKSNWDALVKLRAKIPLTSG